MNKLQKFQKEFEKMGFKTKLEQYKDGYWLDIIGIKDGDGYDYSLTFNKDFEPTIYDFKSGKHILLKDFYKKSIDNK